MQVREFTKWIFAADQTAAGAEEHAEEALVEDEWERVRKARLARFT